MTKLSRYILIIVTIIVSSVILPQLYWMAFDKPVRVPYVQYSCTANDFIINNSTEHTYTNSKGDTFNKNQYEELLPLLFSRQLMVDKKCPDTIRGVAFDLYTFSKARSQVRIRPIDFKAPLPQLYPLFESESGRINLEQPDDVFRIDWRMEFIHANTNTIIEDKSRMFSSALYHKGFKFPAKSISGIPTTRKSCDEGYLIVDSQNQLFHLKMIKTQPFVKKVDLPVGLSFKHIKCVDFKDKLYYAYLIAQDNSIYILTQDDYELKKIPITDYHADTMLLKIQGDYFNYNISLESDGKQKSYALNKEFEVIDTFLWECPTNEEKMVGKVSASIFPFELSLNDPNSRHINLYPKLANGIIWMIVNLSFMLIQILLIKRRNIKINNQIIDIILVALTGLFGFIAVNSFPNKFKGRESK